MQEPIITNELSKLVEITVKTNPNEPIRLIISLDEDTDLEKLTHSLSKIGFNVSSSIPGPIPIIAGSMAAKDISLIAKESKVKKVEQDGQTFALR